MPRHASRSRPRGVGIRSDYRQSARHFYDPHTAKWHNPYSSHESRYSDFVPSNYDERTFITRLFKYARTLLTQTNDGLVSKSPTTQTASAPYSPSDIEMLTSSPSPTIHTRPSPTCCSPCSYNGSSRFQQSPHPYIKPPPRAAFPQLQQPIPTHSDSESQTRKRPLSVQTSPAAKVTVDAGTQYSPPSSPMEPSKSTGKRRGTSFSPKSEQPPTEPAIKPEKNPGQTPRDPSATSSQPRTASSTTLAQSSSSSSGSHGSSPKRARPAKAAVKTMPAKYETCDTTDLVLLISNMLMELIRRNDRRGPLQDGRLTRFHSRAPPGISVIDYLQRLTTHATLSPPILLSMVDYIDRLGNLYPAFSITSLTVHRFLITAATVASKGLSDSFWTNNTYARVGGVSLKELALLELEFLWRMEWRIIPKPEELVDYYRKLVERSEGFRIEGGSSGTPSRKSSDEKMDETVDARSATSSQVEHARS